MVRRSCLSRNHDLPSAPYLTSPDGYGDSADGGFTPYQFGPLDACEWVRRNPES